MRWSDDLMWVSATADRLLQRVAQYLHIAIQSQARKAQQGSSQNRRMCAMCNNDDDGETIKQTINAVTPNNDNKNNDDVATTDRQTTNTTNSNHRHHRHRRHQHQHQHHRTTSPQHQPPPAPPPQPPPPQVTTNLSGTQTRAVSTSSCSLMPFSILRSFDDRLMLLYLIYMACNRAKQIFRCA